jgi:hypothetical protein
MSAPETTAPAATTQPATTAQPAAATDTKPEAKGATDGMPRKEGPQGQAPAEAVKAEPAKEEAAKSEEKDRYSKAFAKLAKQERETRRQQEELKAAAKEIEEYRVMAKQMKAGPEGVIKAMAGMGINFSDVARHLVEGQKPESVVKALEAKIETLAKQNESERQERERLIVEREAEGYRGSYLKKIQTDEQYKFIEDFYDGLFGTKPDAEIGAVYQHYLENENKGLTPDEIADIIRSGAEERLKLMDGKPSFQRLMAKLGWVKKATEPAPTDGKPKQVAPVGNLNSPSGAGPDLEKMTFQERVKRAQEALRNR